MSNLQNIRERDSRLNAITQVTRDKIPAAMKDTPLEKTTSVMMSLTARLRYLKTGILDLIEADNVYCANALYRVFLEHMLRVNAIFLWGLDNISDNLAEQYLKVEIAEEDAYLKGCEKAGLEMIKNRRESLVEMFPNAKTLTDKEIKELAHPFHIRNLINTIVESVKLIKPNFITKIIPNYSRLSGFVHGGPSADRIMNELADGARRWEELKEMADVAVGMLYSAERWLLIMAENRCPDCKSALALLNVEMANLEG